MKTMKNQHLELAKKLFTVMKRGDAEASVLNHKLLTRIT